MRCLHLKVVFTVPILLWMGGISSISGQETPSPADFNGDGTVDFPDFLVFTQAFVIDNPPPLPDISLSVTSLSFGDVETGQSSDLILSISNSGGTELSVTGISSSDDQFIFSAGSFTLAGGGRQDVTVTYSPGADGTYTATLTIDSDDEDEGTLTIPLSGNGVTSVPSLATSITVMTPSGSSHIMRLVPEGDFQMGTDKTVAVQDLAADDPTFVGTPIETTLRTIFLDAFYTDQLELTNDRYVRFLNDIGRNFDPDLGTSIPYYDIGAVGAEIGFTTTFGGSGEAAYPVIFVTWYGADAYCKWMGGRLPTEAEWEKAARGPDGATFPWGETLPAQSFYANIYGPGVDPKQAGFLTGRTNVGSYSRGASVYGVRDMVGNVSEWVADWFDAEYFRVSPAENPQGPASGNTKAQKGANFTHSYNPIHPFDGQPPGTVTELADVLSHIRGRLGATCERFEHSGLQVRERCGHDVEAHDRRQSPIHT